MGIEQLMTNSEKIQTLTRLKSLLSSEIYSLCIQSGMEPDTFDYSTYASPGQAKATVNILQLQLLEKQCKKLILVMSKLEGLNNA